MANFLTDQSPQAKQKRMVAAVGGGAVLALLLLLTRRGGAGEDSELDPLRAASVPSTFADNGEAMGALSTEVTGALGGVASSLEAQNAAQAAAQEAQAAQIAAGFDTLGMTLAGLQAVDQGVVEAPESVSRAGQPGPRRRAAARAKAVKAEPKRHIYVQDEGKRAGRRYKVVTARGKKTRLYESKAGKGDYGEKRGTRIGVGRARPKPKAKPKRKPKRQPRVRVRNPSRPPRGQRHHPATRRKRNKKNRKR